MMRILDKWERKIGKYAIRNLMLYIVSIQFLVFILQQAPQTAVLVQKLVLVPSLVLQGEVWRLVTFIFIPPTTSLIWILFSLYFYYMVGKGLEQEWGSFKFNAYYFIGMLATMAAAFISGGIGTSFYLNMSLFLAFAAVYPEFQVRLFFILPVKMKYLGWVTAGILAYNLIIGGFTVRMAIAAALLNFLLFFRKEMLSFVKHKKRRVQNKASYLKKVPEIKNFHLCTKCGITEVRDKTMEFRYCSLCDGDREYCMDHLHDHEHIRDDGKVQ